MPSANGQASWAYEAWDNISSRAEGVSARWFLPCAALRLPVDKVREERYLKACVLGICYLPANLSASHSYANLYENPKMKNGLLVPDIWSWRRIKW